MKLIIECDPEFLENAVELARQESQVLSRYDRPGWGWRYGRFWVCGIKGGISIRQKDRPGTDRHNARDGASHKTPSLSITPPPGEQGR